MIDLHLHFDGSLPVETVWKLSKRQGIPLPDSSIEALKEDMICPKDCKSLNEYLEKFQIPLSVLQTAEGIREAMEDLIYELQSENMLYAEIRFAPQLHLSKGLTQKEVVEAAIEGVRNATKNGPLKVQLILCCMRGSNVMDANMETVRLTKKYLGNIVCACDLAGAEALFPTESFADLFAFAKALNVPYTIHAGEADGPDSIKSALSFGAKRIGHGIRAVADEDLLKLLVKDKIFLECCPTSNMQTRAIPSMHDNPIKKFLQMGIMVTINTDNRTVSQTNIAKEVSFVREYFGLSADEERQLYLNAVEAAFINCEEKEHLKNVITKII